MASKRNINSSIGIKRFNKILKQTRATLKRDHINISYRDAVRYTSNFVVPALKKTPNHRLFKTRIGRETQKIIKVIPPEDFINYPVPESENVFYLNWGEIVFNADFWQIILTMEELIPNPLFVQIEAGKMGRISKFKRSQYQPHKEKKLKQIIEEIRSFASSPQAPYGKSNEYNWSVSLFHKNGTAEDGLMKNYVIVFELVSDKLIINEKEVSIAGYSKTVISPKGKRTKGSPKKEKAKEFEKKKKKEKSKFFEGVKSGKRQKIGTKLKNLEQEVKQLKSELKQKKESSKRSNIIKTLRSDKKKEIDRLNELLKSSKISKKQFLSAEKRINKKYFI